MESPGEYLKREREHRGLTLAGIFEATRVPMRYLDALEADDYEHMPHPTFVKGYIKSYCKCMGVDENDAVLRYEVYVREAAEREKEGNNPQRAFARAEEKPKVPEEAAPPSSESRNRNVMALAAAGVLILILVYFVSYRNQASAPEEPAAKKEATQAAATAQPGAPSLTEPPQATAQQPIAAQPVQEPLQAQKEAGAAKKTALQANEKKAPEDSLKTSKTDRAQAAASTPAAVKKAASEPPATKAAAKDAEKKTAQVKKAEVKAAVPAEPGQATAAEKKHTLIADAREDVWIKVSIDGAEPFDVLLHNGERVSWKAAETFSVVLGNAGGVDITYDGARLPALGASGEVVDLMLPLKQ